jgi:iron complex outermembrane recepter protein
MKFRICLLAGVALSGVSLVDPAHAQAQSTDEPTDVIVVTGIGPDRSADELIASTTVLDQAAISDRIDGGLGDTLSGLPGVSSTSFGPGASRPIIRGLGAERVQVLTNGIGVIDASAASPDHAVTGDPLGAERIEILRGPAALAYGGGAIGGVVNVIDGLIVEAPQSKTLGGGLYAGHTSVDQGTTLSGRAKISSGAVTGVIIATDRNASDVEIPGFAESPALREEEAAEGKVLSNTPDKILENSFAESDSLAAGVSFANDSGFVGIGFRNMNSRYGLVGGHEHADGEEEAEEETPFIDLEQRRLDIRTGARIDLGPFNRFSASVSGVDYEHTEFEAPGEPGTVFTNDGFEARVELDHGVSEGWSGSVGVQASRRDFAAIGDEAFVTPTIIEQAGVFAFQTFEQGEWGVEGGLRLDKVDLDNVVAGDRSFDVINASAGVHGHLMEDLFMGLSVSRTERAPADVELFADGPHLATQQFEIGDPDLETEKGIHVEATARWRNGPLELSGSVYHFDFDGFIFLSPTGEEEDDLPVFETLQADAQFTGAEIGASLDLGKILQVAWRVDAAADIVEAKLKDGDDLPRIPPASATLGIEGEAGILNGRLQVRWADEQDKVAAFELPTDSWTTVDFRLKAAVTPRVDLILEAANLTDEEVRLHASPLKDLAPQPGRSFRAALLAKF